MAFLQKIRSKAGVLVSAVIGLALLAFILGDMLRSGDSLFSSNRFEIAEVAGKSIPVQLYQQRIEEFLENAKRNSGQNNIDEETAEQIREQAWELLVREFVMEEEYSKLGIDVHPDELFDMVQGNNIYPQIKQIPIFQNQETGEFDRNLVIRFLKNLDQDPSGNARASWLAFEEGILRDRVNTKYNNLLKKAMYITDWEARKTVQEKNKKMNFSYIVKNYNELPDSLISFTEEDVKSYYNNHLNDFEQQATRDIEYVTFDIQPSKSDVESARKWVEQSFTELDTTENAKQLVTLKSDLAFDDKFYKQGELPVVLDTVFFDKEEGFTFGPYEEESHFKISKINKIEFLPDTVRARHILIRPEDYNNNYQQAKAVVDSLKELIDNGASFANLARKHGSDGTAQKGGDLGWFKYDDMVTPFNDSCFFAEKSHVTTVTTQFGIHILEVTDRGKEIKKIQVATLAAVIEPSTETYQFVYSKANEFAGKNRNYSTFITGIEANNLTKRVAPNLNENSKKISGLEHPRPLIRWAFQAEKGNVSQIFELGDRFVVACLVEVREKGTAPLEDVRNQVEMEVKKEKKAEYLVKQFNEKLAEYNNLEAIAKEMAVEVQEATDVNFGAFSIPGIGIEPKVHAYATMMNEGEMSPAIDGKRGVYVIQVNTVTEPEEIGDTEAEKTRLARNKANRVDYSSYEALKKLADIDDKRSNFY